MPKITPAFNPDEYTTVAERIGLFYAAYPNGQIHTRLVSYDAGRVVVEASVFRRETDARPAATGLASEHEKDGEVNAVACLENTETSAIGRALANLGFTGSAKRPSREEMEKAQRAREGLGRPDDADVASSSASAAGIELRYDRTRRVAERAVTYDELQRRADAHVAAVSLLARARRAGFPSSHADALEIQVKAAEGRQALLAPIASELRQWLRNYATAATQTAASPPMS